MSNNDPGQKSGVPCRCDTPTSCETSEVQSQDNSQSRRCTCQCSPDSRSPGLNSEHVQKDASNFPLITPVTGTLTTRDTLVHLLARLGQNRSGHRIPPGLYTIGFPGPESPAIVTANYSLSFDSVRSSLATWDVYILVLDTRGINVWCAAGKGTFGTEELINRIKITGISTIVNHRRLILPQLGAPGVAAHIVHKTTGFHVEYGPVRASDLPEFLIERVATPEMRVVKFGLWDRVVLIPVELRNAAFYTVVATIALWFLGGWLPATGFLAAVLAGTVIFPVLLPYLPSTDFSTKGLALGIVIAIPFAVVAFLARSQGIPSWVNLTAVIAILFTLPVITAYLALNFTGCTPYTSRTGVKKEIYRYLPFLTGFAVIGSVSAIVIGLTKFLGMW